MKYRSKASFSKDGMTLVDTVRLNGSGASFPIKSKEEYKIVQEQYGLSNKLNLSTYIVGGEDIAPKPEDFVKVPFRLLSATIVAAGTWRATNFGNEKVLKASVSKLENKPLYPDHDTYRVENVKGLLTEPVWQASYTDAKGNVIPAGINGLPAVDAVTNPKIARDILTGAINSVSVTIEFEWEQSHDFGEDEYAFYENLGNVINGNMVTRNVTKILNYHELSFVFLGADPYAKKLDENGEVTHVDETSVFNNKDKFTKDNYKELHKWDIACSKDGNLFIDESKFFNSFKNNIDMNNKVEMALKAKLNLQENDELSLEHLDKLVLEGNAEDLSFLKTEMEKSSLTSLEGCTIVTVESQTSLNKEVETLKAENTVTSNKVTELSENLTKANDNFNVVNSKKEELTLSTVALNSKIVELEAKQTENEALINLGKETVDNKRNEVVRLYKVTTGKDSDEAVLGLMEKATSTELDGLLKQYVTTATSAFSGKCKNCGSEEFTFRSTLIEEETVEDKKPLGYDALRARMVEQPSFNINK